MNSGLIVRTVKGLCVILIVAIFSFKLLANSKLDVSKRASYLQVEVIPVDQGSLQQVIIPFDVYQHSNNRNLNDLKVIDSLGNSLAFEISNMNHKIEHSKRIIVVYPLTESRYLLGTTDTIAYKYDSKNKLSEVQSSRKTEKQKKIVGYLLDLGAKKLGFSVSIDFKLSSVNQTAFLKFDIDQSNDLKNWVNLTRNEVLAQLKQPTLNQTSSGIIATTDKADKTIHQRNRIKIPNQHSRYLRLRILDNEPSFSIEAAELQLTSQKTLPLLWSDTQAMVYSAKEKGYILSSSAALAVEKIEFEIPQKLTYLSGELFYQMNNNPRWVRSADINVFRIKNEGRMVLQNTIEVNAIRATEIKLINKSSSSAALKNIKLKLVWSPQKLTFLASGNPPYQIEVGVDKKITSNDQRLLAMIKSQVGSPEKYASLGDQKIIKRQAIQTSVAIDWAKLILWSVLIGGVILMTWMASRLIKKV